MFKLLDKINKDKKVIGSVPFIAADPLQWANIKL